MNPSSFVFDFDSTVVMLESFDELLKAALDGHPEKTRLEHEIETITNAGMNGEIDLSESLKRRLTVATITNAHIDTVRALLLNSITPGMPEIFGLLRERNQPVCIISGGFTELILPVAAKLGLNPESCFANQFLKDGDTVTGIDFAHPLAKSTGKAEIIRQIKAETGLPVIIIGDGMSDAIPFINGIADEFWGFFQNVDRPKVREKALRSFDSTTGLLRYFTASVEVAYVSIG